MPGGPMAIDGGVTVKAVQGSESGTVAELGRYGETARSWDSIVDFYRWIEGSNPVFADISELAYRIAKSPFPAAGLCASTSMHDLILGPSTRVLDNPHLRIQPDFDKRTFVLVFHDGSKEPWTRTVPVAEGYDAVARFLTTRIRWYHET